MNRTTKEIFEPEALATLGTVFDETWAALASELGPIDDATSEQARLRLAGILMELAKLSQLNSEEMKGAAIRAYSEPGMSHSPAQSNGRCDIGAATSLLFAQAAEA
jgi:hypothetical protein